MRITPRVKKLFTAAALDEGEQRLQVIHYEYVEDDEMPDDGQPWEFEVVAEGNSMAALWQAFGSQVAAHSDLTATEAAQAIVSGDDTGDTFTCQDETVLGFLRTLDDAALICAAFECLVHGRVSFRKAGKAIRSCHPEWEFLFEVSVVQMDDVYWVRKLAPAEC